LETNHNSSLNFFLINNFKTFTKESPIENSNKLPVSTPVNTSTSQNPEDTSFYSSNASWLSARKGSITSEDIFKDNYFTLTLQPYPKGNETNYEKVYKIPLSDIDYVSDPKISHTEKYGCVTIEASGYSGYYIFSLPEGNVIDKGKQYSQCC